LTLPAQGLDVEGAGFFALVNGASSLDERLDTAWTDADTIGQFYGSEGAVVATTAGAVPDWEALVGMVGGGPATAAAGELTALLDSESAAMDAALLAGSGPGNSATPAATLGTPGTAPPPLVPDTSWPEFRLPPVDVGQSVAWTPPVVEVGPAPNVDGGDLQAATQLLNALPFRFEQNVGQVADAAVHYVAHGSGYALLLGSAGATFVLNSGPAADALTEPVTDPGDPVRAAAAPPAVVHMQFVGANAAATATGGDVQGGTVNYLLGSDASQQFTNIVSYGQVHYADVWQGIDVHYHGSAQGQLEYDFIVNPGASADTIRLDFAGASGVTVDDAGNLVVHSAAGALTQQAPILYQDIQGTRQEVQGAFVLLGGNQVGFEVGAYDSAYALVIDPVVPLLDFSSYYGGPGNDEALGIQCDAQGNTYIVGLTSSPALFAGLTPARFGAGSGTPGFVLKLDAQGQAVWQTNLGGSGRTELWGVGVNDAGEVYYSGWSQYGGMPTTANAVQSTRVGTEAMVAGKLNAAGTTVLYGTYLGGNNQTKSSNNLVVKDDGTFVVSGQTKSTVLPTTAGAYQSTAGGGLDAYVVLLDPAAAPGGSLAWATRLGKAGDDYARGVAVRTTA